MTVRFVLNGEYRTGTTILYKIIKDSYPAIVPLYEPTTYILKDHFNRILQKRKQDKYLHGFDPYDYLLNLTLEELKLLEKYYELLRRDPYRLLFGDLIPKFVEELQGILNRTYFIQPNNWQFKLHEIDVKSTHIIRNPIDQWMDYLRPFLRPLPDKILRVMQRRDLDPRFGRQFFLDLEFNAIAKHFKLPKNVDPFTKFLYYYTYGNYYVYEKSKENDNIQIIYYEELCKSPREVLIRISQHAKIPVILNYTNQIKKNYMFRYSKRFAEVTLERLKELELLDKVKEFLPEWIFKRAFML